MANDKQTYDRGVVASLIGLGVQFVLTLVAWGLSLWTESHGIKALTWHALGGIPIWGILILVYHQHRVFLRESQSSELMSEQDAESAALFGDRSDELQLAERRLAQLYKWGLNGISLLTSIYLILIGLYLYYWAARPVTPIKPEISTLTLMFVAFGIALVAFTTGRYISGYTRVREWQLLRGGAGYLMSIFLLVLLVGLGAVLSFFFEKNQWLFMLLSNIIPIGMVVIGVEILLNLLFSAYRPRRMGEIPRPAFDSRLLGMLTSSESLGQVVAETINYQFGFDVSGKDLYKGISRQLPVQIILIACFLLLLSTVVIVDSNQNGICLRFGKYQNRVLEPGLHFKLPWPVESVQFQEIGRIEQVRVGTKISNLDRNTQSLLWESDSDIDNYYDYFLTTSSHEGVENVGASLLAAEVIVQYRINDLTKYLKTPQQLNQLIQWVTQRAITRYCISKEMYELLTVGRREAVDVILNDVRQDMNRLDVGVEIVFVGVTSIHPPLGNVSRSFHEPVDADQDRMTAIDNAEIEEKIAYIDTVGSLEMGKKISQLAKEIHALNIALETAENQDELNAELDVKKKEAQILLTDAKGVVAKRLLDARKLRWEKINQEKAAISRFQGEREAYAKAPEYYKAKRYYETLSKGLANRRKYVIINRDIEPEIEVDLTEEATGIQSILSD